MSLTWFCEPFKEALSLGFEPMCATCIKSVGWLCCMAGWLLMMGGWAGLFTDLLGLGTVLGTAVCRKTGEVQL